MKIKLALIVFLSHIYYFGKTQSCTLPSSCLTELVTNGDFSMGNTGFTSDYLYSCDCSESICVGSEPRDKCPNTWWIDDLWDFDQGNSTGRYLIIDGANDPDKKLWEQNVYLETGKTYRFTFYVMPTVSNLIGSPGQTLDVDINFNTPNEVHILTTLTGSYASGLFVWNERCAVFTYTGPTGSFPLRITQQYSEGNGDYGIDHISLQRYNAPVISLPSQVVKCYGDANPVLGGNFGTGSYVWKLGSSIVSTNMYYTPTAPGNYCLTYTNSTGCSATACVNVIFSTVINVSGNSYTSCAEEITICPVVGPGTYTYNWGGGSTSIPCSTFVAAGTGLNVYPVTVTNNDNCSINVNVSVDVLSTPIIHTSSPITVCQYTGVVLSATVSGPYAITWTDPMGNLIPGGNPVTVFPPVGVSTYTASSTNPSNGCTGTAQSTVTVNPLPHVTSTLNLYPGCDSHPIFLGKKNNLDGEMFWTNGFSPTGIGAYFTPQSYIQVNTIGSTTFYSFDPNLNAPGVYNFIYNYTDPSTGCSNQAVGYITVATPPLVTITGDLDICDLVNGTDLDAQVSFSPDPYTYLWSPGGETSSGIHVTNSGTYSVTVTNTVTNCSAIATVTVNYASQWHQQTQNSTSFEEFNDVITDEEGNVYVVGTFRKTTFLNGGTNPDIQINSLLSTINPNTFVAKYDECGNLIWVSNTTLAENCIGSAITYDRVNKMIYIGGTFQGQVTFNGSQSSAMLCTSGYSQNLNVPDIEGYVAQFDAISGCLYFAQSIDLGNETRLNALTINENNGNLFVGGSFWSTGPSTEIKAFIHKYIPITTSGTASNLGSVIWSLVDNGNTPLTFSVVNDLDYSETMGRLFIIGSFKKIVKLFNGSSTSFVNTSSSINDAFFAIYRDNTSAILVIHRAGGTTGSNYMTGEGIAVDNVTGRFYFTGSYNGTNNNPFELASVGATVLSGVGQNKAYMASANVTSFPTSAWTYSTYPTISIGSSFGRDVTAHNNRAYFVGEFSMSSMSAFGFGTYPYFGGTGSTSAPTKHVSMIGYTSTGASLSMNVTMASTNTAPDSHKGTAIATNRNGFSFITGQFSKFLGYFSGNPVSGSLISSGAANAFIMRLDESNGDFRTAGALIESTNAIENIEYEQAINIYPNPTSGLTTITIDNFDRNNNNYKVTLFNAQGKLMETILVNSNKFDIDLSNYESGIYFLLFNDGIQSKTVRISKAG